MKRLLIIGLLLMLLFAPCAAENEAAQLEADARMLHEMLSASPAGVPSLNMERPFAPIKMEVSMFDRRDEVFFRELGIGEGDIGDIVSVGASRWSGTDSDGRMITVIFCGAYGEAAFVFERNADGDEYLLDVLFGTNDNTVSAEIVELAGARYLLTNGYGHGSGAYRGWTNWYNLDLRKMELRMLREGYENLYQVFAEAVTTTNVDDALDLSDTDRPEYLRTYTYTSVCAYGSGEMKTRMLLDSDCTVRVYQSTRDGLQLMGERVFSTVVPGVLEQATEDELLDDSWLLAEKEKKALDTMQASDDTLRGLLIDNLPSAKVVHADWVNLRSEGNKESSSIGAIDAGDTVYILAERQGTENGWTKVLWMPARERARIGYIWWSFLEKGE